MAYTFVDLTHGTPRAFADCDADVFGEDVLVLTNRATDTEVDRIPAGRWLHATVFDAQGYPLYSHHARRQS